MSTIRKQAALVNSTKLYYIPVATRVPLKFGSEVTTSVICARASVELCKESRPSTTSIGWGETPLNVQWVWPGNISYDERLQALCSLTEMIARSWSEIQISGHPLEIGHHFITKRLPSLLAQINQTRESDKAIPWLAALVCASPFDIATHDSYGILMSRPTYATYGPEYLVPDLSTFLEDPIFKGKYPTDYLHPTRRKLLSWHLVGGLDPISPTELTGNEPTDDYPVLLDDWITNDGLQALKIKLRGDDAHWDYQRLVTVGEIAARHQVTYLSADFNCTVTNPEYVNQILDRLRDNEPNTFEKILYVEQPFPYDLEKFQIDVRSVASRIPLFMDESAHDWKLIKLGRSLGWNGVALKTCKTQTGAILSLCWAKHHGMKLMVQDLTNPMIAQISHLQLASHCDTIMGVETNSMQFYPAASLAEEKVHPHIYKRREGHVDLSTLKGNGFGYRVGEIQRILPNPIA